MKSWKSYLRRDRSVIVDIFQGQIRSTLQGSCGHKSFKFDPFQYLTLPMNSTTKSVTDCLKLFCEEERLHGTNQWYCSKCKRYVDATKKLDLWTLPPILIISLKRFDCNSDGKRKKLSQEINIPIESWSLSNFVKYSQTPSLDYDLYAIIHHYGDENQGHYTADACNRKEEWHTFNDSRSASIQDEILSEKVNGLNSSSAYILFYNRAKEIDDDNSNPLLKKSSSVLRQSLNRPFLWPHNINSDLSGKREEFRKFTRVRSSYSTSSDECFQSWKCR